MSIEACADLVRQADPDRFMSVLAAPVDKRAGLLAVYAFNVEVSRAPWVTDEPLIGKMRLQWWTDALDELSAGGIVRRHDVTSALSDVGSRDLWQPLHAVVRGRDWDTDPQPFPDWDALRGYTRQTSGMLYMAAGIATGVAPDDRILEDFGTCAGVASLLRAVPEMKRRGIDFLPTSEPAELSAFARAEKGILTGAKRKLSREAFPAARAGWQTNKLLSLVAANPTVLSTDGLHIPEFSKKVSLLWRAFLNRP